MPKLLSDRSNRWQLFAIITLGFLSLATPKPASAQACAGCVNNFGYSITTSRSNTSTTTTSRNETYNTNSNGFAISGVNVTTAGALSPTASYFLTTLGANFNFAVNVDQTGLTGVNINTTTTTSIVDAYSASLF
jgi:hypothetical protein